MHMGLQLLTVALESGHLANYQSLLVLVKDELCRHLLQVLEDAEENIVLYCDKKKKKKNSPAFHFCICCRSH